MSVFVGEIIKHKSRHIIRQIFMQRAQGVLCSYVLYIIIALVIVSAEISC